MASRKIFNSIRWKLFIPLLTTMWVIVGVLSYVQYKSINDFNVMRLRRQMLSATSDILNYYENNENPRSYLTFLNEFAKGTILEELRLSVYERDRLAYSRGPMIPQSYARVSERPDSKENFYVMQRSNNGEIVVIGALPLKSIARTDGPSAHFWWLVVVLMIVSVIVSYFSTSYLMRNIKLLHRFAQNAANGDFSFDQSKFTHDELGDISRQIIKLYNDKAKALRNATKEHEMTMFAVEEKSRIKRQLTNNINHEIKTPVGVIRGYLDTVVNSPDMDDEIKNQFLARAHSNVVRLCNLLNDVSTMTRLEESNGNIQTIETDFHELVFSVYTDLSASGVLGEMEFDIDIPINCMVRGNNNLLTGAISNLIRNAAQHSHGTEIGLRLVIESERFYTFSFYDNGTGVEDEHLPHLFERFYRVDAGRSRKAGGTGLGLPIVKNAIEALGGSISVHNRTAGGLEFMFTLEKWQKQSKSKKAKKEPIHSSTAG